MEFIRKTVVQSILPATVRATASTKFPSVDFETRPWLGLAKFFLDAEAQGSSDEVDVKLQESDPIAEGGKYETETSLGDTILRSGADTNIKLGARFTQDGDRQVKKIILPLKRTGTIAAGKIVKVSLYTEDTDAPDALLGTSENVLCTAIGTDYENVEFTFLTPVDLADVTDYFVILEGDYTESGSNCISWQTDTVASGGNFIHFTDAWQSGTTTKSFWFANWEYNFTDIVGGAFTTVENEAATEDIVLNIDNMKAYIRAVAETNAGANAGATCLIMIGAQKYPE
ncbi:MAG: hypothetical protein KKH94_11385 [Candidatus Omnitrophica bacterium]|nr:hypothetical protein [Candidatus Omnitrophota bacterium]